MPFIINYPLHNYYNSPDTVFLEYYVFRGNKRNVKWMGLINELIRGVNSFNPYFYTI